MTAAGAPTFDLQSHSDHSDGALPPDGVVRLAARSGVRMLALTDHDSVDGVPEAMRSARREGLLLVPAVELSAVDGGREDLHILGYGVDPADGLLLGRLQDARADRGQRAERMIAALREQGLGVDERPLRALLDAGRAVGRPHVAAAALSHPDSAGLLRRRGISDAGALLEAYLVPGAPAYFPRRRPTVAEAIEWIHDAGGVAVWAHPFWDVHDPQQVLATLQRFLAVGLDGVECFYRTHTAEQAHLLADACEESWLLATGSADFHGPEHRLFSSFRAFDLYGREPRLGSLGEPGR